VKEKVSELQQKVHEANVKVEAKTKQYESLQKDTEALTTKLMLIDATSKQSEKNNSKVCLC